MRLLPDVYLVGSGEIGLSNSYDCHVYVLDGGDDAVLIDSGSGIDSERLVANIAQHIDIDKLSRVLLTHVHADHAGGAGYFQRLGKTVLVSPPEAELVSNSHDQIAEALCLAKNAGAYPTDYEYRFFTPDGVIHGGQSLRVGTYQLVPILMRGHSPGLLCFYLATEQSKVLFSSDQVFVNGSIGLLNAPGSNLEDYRRDIAKLSGLAIDALLPGHRLFVLTGGQDHIDRAVESLSRVFVPPTF